MPEVLKIERFHGGMTDLYIGAAPHYAQFAKNLLVDRNGKIFQRPGTELFFRAGDSAQLPNGDETIDDSAILWRKRQATTTSHDSFIMAKQRLSLYYIKLQTGTDGELFAGSSWTEIPKTDSLGGNVLFGDRERIDFFHRSDRHLYFTGHFVLLSRETFVTKVFDETGGVLEAYRVGLPAPVLTSAVKGSGMPPFSPVGSGPTVIYHAFYERTYTLEDGREFIDRGPTITFEQIDAEFEGFSSVSINQHITLTFDLSDIAPSQSVNNFYGVIDGKIKLRVFRTKSNETIAYEVAPNEDGWALLDIGPPPAFQPTTVDNSNRLTVPDAASVDFLDKTSEGFLHTREIVYTASGELDSDPPSEFAKYITYTDDGVAWYSDGDDRAYHSKPGAPDAVPITFFKEFDSPVVGMGSLRNHAVVFEAFNCSRMEGLVDALGRGTIRKREISGKTGCISHSSIIEVDRMLYFASWDGIYRTDGFRVEKLTDHLDDRYKELTKKRTQRNSIEAKYDFRNLRLYYSFRDQEGDTGISLTTTWVIDLNFPVENGQSTVTEYVYNENLIEDEINGIGSKPTSNIIVDGTHFKFDNHGYMYKYDENLTEDVIRDTVLAEANWREIAVSYTWKSAAWDFGSPSLRKWVTQARLWLKNLSDNITLQLTSFNDDKQYDPRRMKPVALTNKTDGFHIFKRWFPNRTLRCMYKQLQISNQDTIILAQSGDATDVALAVFGTPGEPSLQRFVGGFATPWPDDLVGQHVYIAADNYQDPYLITNFTNGSDTIRLSDPALQLPAGSHLWRIRGQNTGERFKLEALEIPYVVLGEAIDADPEA